MRQQITKSHKNKPSSGPTASELKSIRRFMADHQLEHKYDEATSVTMSTAGTITSLYDGLTQGSSNVTRTGDRIFTDKLSLKWFNSATASDQFQRVVIFYDKSSNGAIPAVTDVLDSASYSAFWNHQNVVLNKRFVILYDHTISQSVNGPAAFYEEWYHKCALTVGFLGDAGTAADLATNQIYFLFIGTGTSGVAFIRLRGDFTDA
jgi:hypothetical protein